MGLFGFFEDKPTAKSIDKLVLKVKERYAKPEFRREAMDRLLAWNTPEALTAVLARFTVVVQSPHWDEEEKRWLVDELAVRGDPAKTAVLAFLHKEDHVAFAAKALMRLSASKDEWLDGMIGALGARPPEDHRTVKGKADLVHALADDGDARVVAAVLPYVDDHADEVQTAALDCIAKHHPASPPDVQAQVTAKLQAVVTDDARSARVLRHAAAVMSRLQLPVDPQRPLAPAVTEDFVVKAGVLASAH